MTPWIRRAAAGFVTRFWPAPRQRTGTACRARRRRPALDALETRATPSPVGGSVPIAMLGNMVETPGEVASLDFQLGTGRIDSNRRVPMLLAFTATPAPGSSVEPDIVRIGSTQGLPSGNLSGPTGPLFTQVAVPSNAGPATTYRARVSGLNRTIGGYVLTAYLPGDTNGDGVVDRTDLAVVRTAYGSVAGSSQYRSQADMNQDGRVGTIDWIVTKRNLGARSSMADLSQPGVTPT